MSIITNRDDYVDPRDYSRVVQRLRAFFDGRGYTESYVQNQLTVLRACENPASVTTLCMGGHTYATTQSGQMSLEDQLLDDPSLQKLYCMTTSYRNEQERIPGRHQLVFPLFEFEAVGTYDELVATLQALVAQLGFPEAPKILTYAEACAELKVDAIEAAQEEALWKAYGDVIFLTHFPESSSPFFNMRRAADGTALKVDVLLCGWETFGCASRSNNPQQMVHSFKTISDGGYAKVLYNMFGKERVDQEVQLFTRHTFRDRFGGGIGLTRLIRALTLRGLLHDHVAGSAADP